MVFSLAFIEFLVLSPIFLVVAIGLYFANDGKSFFFQLRPGKYGKIFKIIKFKTMNDKKIPWKTVVGIFIMILYGYYFEKMIKDSFYTKLLSLFILANIIWVVFMQTNFHYRIAYLSLFLYPLLILYPLKFIDNIYRNLVRK